MLCYTLCRISKSPAFKMLTRNQSQASVLLWQLDYFTVSDHGSKLCYFLFNTMTITPALICKMRISKIIQFNQYWKQKTSVRGQAASHERGCQHWWLSFIPRWVDIMVCRWLWTPHTSQPLSPEKGLQDVLQAGDCLVTESCSVSGKEPIDICHVTNRLLRSAPLTGYHWSCQMLYMRLTGSINHWRLFGFIPSAWVSRIPSNGASLLSCQCAVLRLMTSSLIWPVLIIITWSISIIHW